METQTENIKSSSEAGIEIIESLVQQGKFSQTLSEIEKVENHPDVELSFADKGDLHYLASVCLYNVGRYKEAMDKATLAFEIFKDTSENEKVAQIQYVVGKIHWGLGDVKNAELFARGCN